MPLGDPGGGNFTYIDEGLPVTLFMTTIPCKDIDAGISFYEGILGMELLYRKDREVVLRRGSAIVMLRQSKETGVDTGLYFGVENPFDLHRRLVDEGVVFIKDPMRTSMGVSTSFKDNEGNILHAIEMSAEIRP